MSYAYDYDFLFVLYFIKKLSFFYKEREIHRRITYEFQYYLVAYINPIKVTNSLAMPEAFHKF